jgi:hypothetical protein
MGGRIRATSVAGTQGRAVVFANLHNTASDTMRFTMSIIPSKPAKQAGGSDLPWVMPRKVNYNL